MTSVDRMKDITGSGLSRFLTLSMLLFAIPILGWLTSMYVESLWESAFHDSLISEKIVTEEQYRERELSYLNVCGTDSALSSSTDPTTSKFCSGAEEILHTRLAAGSTAAIGILLIGLITLGKVIAGNSRRRLSIIFPPLIRLVMLALAISVLAQACLLVYSIYTLEAAAIQRVHGGLLVVIGLGALFGCFKLLQSAFSLFRVRPLPVRAELLSPEDSEIHLLVDQVAAKLNAARPDNIIVGLEPNFYVTTSPLQLIGQATTIKGRTLFMSLALLEVLSKDELIAVIGHELGHFRGEDTAYSLKFAPIYARLTSALNAMTSSDSDASQLALLPASAVLTFALGQFSESERTIGRERELIADRAGVEAANADALATALMKISLFGHLWPALTEHHIQILADGRYFENLAETYRGICAESVKDLNWDDAKAGFATYIQPHPIDTHPPLGQRLQALNVSIDTKEISALAPSVDASIHFVSESEEIEKRLSILEIQWLKAIGAIVIPDRE